MTGFAGFLGSMRGGAEDRPDPLTRARLAPDRPDEPFDEDERQANLLAAGYAPGLLSGLTQEYADVTARLAAEQDKLAAGRKAEERIARMREAGQITALEGWRRLDGDYGDPGEAARLERRAARLKQQIADVQAQLAPAQRRAEDPLEAASRRAHQAFREVTRAKMAEMQQGPRPGGESRPFGGAGGLAARSEPVTCKWCLECGFSPEQSFLVHSDPAPQECPSPPGGPCTCFETAGQDGRQREELTGRYQRVYPLEEHRVIRRAQGGDGRTVEAYAAVFNEQAEIHDQMGDYFEEIDPAAWDGRLAEARRARGGLAAEIKCMFNHSMTRQGTPSDKWSLPVGKPLDIRPDSRGLLTVTRYSDDDVLSKIKAGEITSQSFVGACLRSSPELRRGERYQARGGVLPVVRRLALGLKEYGPVLWAAYTGAEILGVRTASA